ncbi:type I-E CRISPR-associated protein Cse2/CasB [Methylomonas paludis]|uniref:Type I-E CRISPR-associated protein Cse2/CasB n=1 Tax=Methylomonas paludis TaxID=1173101 RepID=A0A975MMI8_9GAMM|nr:type I-E CRISPR-associated protein Cse2/CasB [Methylomonas paludis]QWF70613.1 type I-E CRISPR-associated protein Cse2/CasB [Methylomonas paludis]
MTEKKPPILFQEEHPASVALLECWGNLLQYKGDRAELRRCKNLHELQKTSAYQRNYWKLINEFKNAKEIPNGEQIAIIIALSAYINDNKTVYEEDGEKKTDFFGYQISRGEKPKLSEIRFRRLLKINDREKLFRYLIQVIRLLEKKVNLLDLLRIAFFWGDKIKIELAYKYYEKANL